MSHTISLQQAELPESASLHFAGSPKPDSAQWALLGLIRFVLAMIVVLTHCHMFVSSPLDDYLSIHDIASSAVLGFFLISGYSICHSVIKKPDGFGSRRFWRIYPTYIGALIFGLVVLGCCGSAVQMPRSMYYEIPNPIDIIGYLFMLQGTFTAYVLIIGPSWSLTIECAYYALAPALNRLSLKALCALMTVSMLLNFVRFTLPIGNSGAGIFTLLWAWLSGFTMRKFPNAPASLIFLVLMPALFVMTPAYDQYNVLTMTLVGITLYFAREIPQATPRVDKAMSWLGDLSYPLYLVHIPAFVMIYELTKAASIPLFCTSALVSALIFLYAIDLPCRKWAAKNPKASQFTLGLQSLIPRQRLGGAKRNIVDSHKIDRPTPLLNQ